MRIVASAAAVALMACAAMAASPKIESAIKTFKAVGADPAKLKLFCAMDAAMGVAEQKKDKASVDAVVALMKQLGAEFETAWSVGEDLDDDSPDGKVFVSALDELTDKCP